MDIKDLALLSFNSCISLYVFFLSITPYHLPLKITLVPIILSSNGVILSYNIDSTLLSFSLVLTLILHYKLKFLIRPVLPPSGVSQGHKYPNYVVCNVLGSTALDDSSIPAVVLLIYDIAAP